MGLAKEYGPLFRLAVPGGGERLIGSSQAIANELCDETRFQKELAAGLKTLNKSPLTAHGLFTSESDDPLWSRAHNILMPEFSQQSMARYFPKMLDIAQQLMLEVGASRSRFDCGRNRGYDSPDPGYNRVVRVRLSL